MMAPSVFGLQAVVPLSGEESSSGLFPSSDFHRYPPPLLWYLEEKEVKRARVHLGSRLLTALSLAKRDGRPCFYFDSQREDLR